MFGMMNRRVTVAIIAVVGVGLWLLANNFGFLGPGKGSGTGQPGAVKEGTEKSSDGLLVVRIEGNRILVQDKEMSAEEVAFLAKRNGATVIVTPAPDAQIGPYDRLVEEFRRMQIHYVDQR